MADDQRAQVDPKAALAVYDPAELYETAPCGYLAALPDGRIIKANRTFLEWIGYECEEVLGRRLSDFLNIAGKIYFETHFAPLLRMQGFFHEVALDFVRKDGSRMPALVNSSERRDAGGAPLLVQHTIFNATDRRRYEHELLEARRAAEQARAELSALNVTLEQRVAEEVAERMKAEEALRQAQKMEAVGQLTGGVAHDFNNLLTVIIGGLDTIDRQLDSLPDDPVTAKIRRSRNMARMAAQRAAALTSRLLAFARRQPLNPKPIDPGRLITGLSELLQRTLGEAVALEVVAAAGLWLAKADPNELENVIVNLAVNARDAMPGGGRLTIEAHNAYLDDAYVDTLMEPVPPGQYVMIAVSDTGTGMDAETVEKVFEPFFTTKPVGKGTGLGLSQVYGFIRQSGGHVRIYSEVGHGTTVKLYLPRYVGSEQPIDTRPQTPQAVERGDETILVVEDHPDLRLYAANILRELGYRVLEAGDAREALGILEGEGEVDLVFTDVVLPGGMDGRVLVNEALRLRPRLRALFTTGYTRNAIVHNGRLDAGVNLLPKPFTYEQLARKVRAVLDEAATAPA